MEDVIGGDWVFILFFKQKTAYEIRISDWSSDVCSSDLGRFFILKRAGRLSKSGHSLPLQPSQPHRIVPSACCAPVVLRARTKWRMTLLFANAKNAFEVALNATVSPQSGSLLHGSLQ